MLCLDYILSLSFILFFLLLPSLKLKTNGFHSNQREAKKIPAFLLEMIAIWVVVKRMTMTNNMIAVFMAKEVVAITVIESYQLMLLLQHCFCTRDVLLGLSPSA